MGIVERREVEQEKEICWLEEGAGDELHSRMKTVGVFRFPVLGPEEYEDPPL